MTSKQKTVRISKFSGVQLRKDPFELKKDEQTVAKNVDITDVNKVRRRSGYASVRTTANRKIWGNNTALLAVEGENLVQFAADLTPTVVRSDLHPAEVPDFCEVGTDIYYSGVNTNGKFVNGVHTDWAVEEPTNTPVIAVTSGALYEGCYHFVMTYEHTDGRESGCGNSQKIEVASSGSGIQLTSIPQPTSANIAYIRFYLTEANSSTLLYYGRVAVGATSFLMNTRRRYDPLMTQFLRPPPAGKFIGFCASRMLVAVGPTVFYSQPFSYHLFDLAFAHFTVSGDINMIATTKNGAFISADMTYYINLGVTPAVMSDDVFKEKAITGSLTYVNATDIGQDADQDIIPLWLSENGLAFGNQAGQLVLFNDEAIDIGQSSNGATLMRDDRGITQVLTTARKPSNENIYVSDTVEVTVKKRGTLETFNIVTSTYEPIVTSTDEPLVYKG